MFSKTSRLLDLLIILTIVSTVATTTATNCTYPSQVHIRQVFSNLEEGNFSGFFYNVVDDVDWNVQGTHPLSGRYPSKTLFVVNAVARLAQAQNLDLPDTISLVNVIGGCSEEWSVQELREQAVMKNGRFWTLPFSGPMEIDRLSGLTFDNTYSWVTRWSTQGQIVQVRAYLDSALVSKAIYENETPTNSTYHTPRTALEPGPGGLPNLTAILGPGYA